MSKENTHQKSSKEKDRAHCGKYKGRLLSDIAILDSNYFKWYIKTFNIKLKTIK